MEPLDKKERELLEILLTDNKAMDNFLIESQNPRFLYSLNGNNDKKINIFSNGHIIEGSIWEDKSAFLWPSIYLERIVERLSKETIQGSIKNKYIEYILSALKNIISGYIKENKKSDFTAVQITIKIIKNLGINYLDDDILNFFNSYIEDKCGDSIIFELLDILKQLIDNENHKVEKLLLTIIKATPNEASGDNYFYDIVKDFFVKDTNLSKLVFFCSMDFIKNIANSLANIINIRKYIVIEEKIEMFIKKDCSIDVIIRDSNVKFNLPYVEFSEKYSKILPIIEEKMKDYNDSKKQKLRNQILYFYTHIWGDLTYISYASLNNDPSISFKEQESLLIYLLKEILHIKLKNSEIDDFNKIYLQITEKNKYFIFKRILLYCYGKEFKKTRKELFEILNKEKNLLFSNSFEAEIYNIMEENVSNFKDDEIKTIETLIENGPYEEIDWLDDDIIKKYKSSNYKKHWKQSQYAPLKSREPFKSKYHVLLGETKIKEFFNFKNSMTFQPVKYNSKFSDDDAIFQIKNSPLNFVKELEKFDNQPNDKVMASIYETPCIEGVADQLQRLAKQFPKEITEAINYFSALHPVYIRHILYGLRETPYRQNILWPNIFKFIDAYIKNLPNIVKEKSNKYLSKHNIYDIPNGKDEEYTISAFTDMLSEEKDSTFLEMDKAIALLLQFIKKLLNKYQFEPPVYNIIGEKKVPADYLTMSINTPTGRVLEKLLRLIIGKNPSDIRNIKDLYNEMLNKKVVEAYVFLGLYFIYFYKTMKDWTMSKTNLILQNSGELECWEMFFEGFVKSNTQYLDYYEWMCEHYKKAIDVYTESNFGHFMNLIAQFFIAGKDKLDDKSLLKYCVKKKAFGVLSKCISSISFKINKGKFYRVEPSKEDILEEGKIIPKAIELWNFLWKEQLENVNCDKPSDVEKDFLSHILDLIPALDKLDTENYMRISKIFNSLKPKINGTSHILSDLIYVVKKPNNDSNAFLYLGKLYKKLIENIDYFIIEDLHKEIIKILMSHQSNPKIKQILDQIKSIYINKYWYAKYLEWFSL